MENYMYAFIAAAICAIGLYYYKYHYNVVAEPEGEQKEKEESAEIFDIPEEIPKKKKLEGHEPETNFN